MTPTKGNFSQAPSDVLAAAIAKNYVALHVEQGVPVLDRDLNLLGDLLSAALQRALSLHVGSGVPGTTDFQITTNGSANDFAISGGTCIVNGWDVTLSASTSYALQAATPALPPLAAPASGVRIDTVYLDVWQSEVDDSAAPAGDPSLGNPNDVGVRTSTRVQVSFLVRVAVGTGVPPATPGHWFYPLAQLSRPAGANVPGTNTPSDNTITDLRQTGLSLAPLVARIAAIESVLKPIITQIAPDIVLPGQTNPVVITGKNFDYGTSTVTIGGTPAVVDPSQTSATSLSIVVPTNVPPGTWPLVVQNAIGSSSSPYPITVQTPPPPPVFVPSGGSTPQLSPATAPVNTTLTLNGTHFLGMNRVTFDLVPPVYVTGAGILSVSDTVITLTIPNPVAPDPLLPVGSSMTLTVSMDGNASMTATSTALFTVASTPIPTPKFTGVGTQITTSPATSPVTQAPGGVVTLNGTNFGTSQATTTVQFQGTTTVPAATTDYVSIAPSAIQVKVPAGLAAGTYKVIVIVQTIEVVSNDSLKVT